VNLIVAQPAPSTQPTNAPPIAEFLRSPLALMLIVVVIMMLFMSKSKRGEERKRQDMLGQLKKGDEIQTIGGIIGKVIEAREDRVLVKVDETANAKIWFSRNAIHRVLDGEKAEAK
jgi:preprotein translocase subunit YajC